MLAETPFNSLTGEVIGAAIQVHRTIGPGMLESVYHRCLVYELRKRGCECVTQRLVPLVYEGIALDATYRLDLLVNEKVVVEIKSVERLLSVHEAQVLTYLRLANSPIGLLINFNVAKLTDGVKRLINPRWRIP